MTPQNFSSYQRECYNPGSPSLRSQSPPLKNLLKDKILNDISEDENNAVKHPEPFRINLRSKRKLKDPEINQVQNSPSKKRRMEAQITKMQEQMADSMREMREIATNSRLEMQQTFTNLEKKFDSSVNDLKQNVSEQLAEMKVGEQFEVLNNKVSNLQTSFEKSEFERKVSEERLGKVEDGLEDLKATMHQKFEQEKDNLASEVAKKLSKQINVAWKANLARDVTEHEKGMMIFGYRLSNEDDDIEQIKRFLKSEMKVPDAVLGKLHIKEVIRIGKDDPNKSSTLLVNFRHSSERNSLLPYSTNLKQGISIEKNIPREYQQTYKEFKRYAKDFKRIHGNVQTQIIFESCQMVLRYRVKGDNFDYFRLKEFCPEPSETFGATAGSNVAKVSRPMTPIVDLTANSETMRSIIVTGVKTELSGTDFIDKWKDYLEEVFDNVEKIEKRDRDVTIITCKQWSSCNPLVEKFRKKAFLGQPVKFSVFCPTDPNLK